MKTIDQIINMGAVFYKIEREQLLSRNRKEPLARIRFSIMGACRAEGYTLQAIGTAMNRDHASVSYSAKQVTPENMGQMWDDHQAFMEIVKAHSDSDQSPEKDVMAVLKSAISVIDHKVQELGQTRIKMVKMLEEFEPEPSWHDRLP